ncbi:MAG: Rieske (2Fe-2S) protein [Pseudonocardiales bacterium]
MPHDENHRRQGTESAVTRRAVVAGTGILAVTAALAGCSSYGGQGTAGGQPTAPGYPPEQPPAASPGAPPAASTGAALASTADIPVGGGEIFAAQEVVVTQATPGEFRAFSAICTHQQCPVSRVADGTINCTCHGSKFAVADGSVVNGPAKKPLPERQIVVEGDRIQLV